MINKSFKEYTEKIFDKEENYNKIVLKSLQKKKYTKKIINIAAVFILAIVVAFTSNSVYAKIKWNIEFKDYQREPKLEAKGRLEKAKENDFAEVLDMDYITQDGVGVKVDSILITDDCFDANISFKFDKNIEVNAKELNYNFVVYDENNNIYHVYERMESGKHNKNSNYTQFIYKDLGIKYNKKDIFAVQSGDSTSIGITKIDEENRIIKTNLTIRNAKANFPKSKKIKIRIENVGYNVIDFDVENKKIKDSESFKISNSKWLFEIDVPEKFYERETYELMLKKDIPNIEIEDIKLTEVGLNVYFKSKEYVDLIMQGKDMEQEEFRKVINEKLYISDENGKVFNKLHESTTSETDGFKIMLDVGKEDLKNKLYLNFNTNGKNYKEELIRK